MFELAIVPLSSMFASHSWEAEETEEGSSEIVDDIVGDDPDKVNPMEARMNCADKSFNGVPK